MDQDIYFVALILSCAALAISAITACVEAITAWLDGRL